MDLYKVVLFGHRDITAHKKIEAALWKIFEKLLSSKSFIDIYIGRNGEFDVFAASVLKRIQKHFGNERISMTLVLPYTVKDISYYEDYYDAVFIPDFITKTHPKGAIRARNLWMVRQCDLLICYVDNDYGGAHAALKHAEKLKKSIINLSKTNFFEP